MSFSLASSSRVVVVVVFARAEAWTANGRIEAGTELVGETLRAASRARSRLFFDDCRLYFRELGLRQPVEGCFSILRLSKEAG